MGSSSRSPGAPPHGGSRPRGEESAGAVPRATRVGAPVAGDAATATVVNLNRTLDENEAILRALQAELCDALAVPSGWRLEKSERTGFQYYYHIDSGRSQYEYPDGEYTNL
jgi:hypothetical protein